MVSTKRTFAYLPVQVRIREIHLEIVSDLSTESFMLAFWRFASQHSLPTIMLFDNASTYLATAGESKVLLECDKIKEAFGQQGVHPQGGSVSF